MKKEQIITLIDDMMVECGQNLDNNNDYDTISYFGNKLKQEIRLRNRGVMENYILVQIKEIDYVNIIFEEDFIDGNEFKTQNMIIAVLNTLGFKEPKVILCGREFRGE